MFERSSSPLPDDPICDFDFFDDDHGDDDHGDDDGGAASSAAESADKAGGARSTGRITDTVTLASRLITSNLRSSEDRIIDGAAESGDDAPQKDYWLVAAPGFVKEVRIERDPLLGTGGLLWPAAERLGAYLCSRLIDEARHNAGGSHFLRDKTVVELGAGTGVVGIALLQAAASVSPNDTPPLGNTGVYYATDLPHVLPLVERNFDLNLGCAHDVSDFGEASGGGGVSDGGAVSVVRSQAKTVALPWGESLPTDRHAAWIRPDVVLLADCIYLESLFEPLLSTLLALTAPRQGDAARTTTSYVPGDRQAKEDVEVEVYLCLKHRRRADRRFLKLLRRHFATAAAPDDDRLLDADTRRAFDRDNVHLWRCLRK